MISVIAIIVLSVLLLIMTVLQQVELQDALRYRWVRKSENYSMPEILVLSEEELDDEIDRHLAIGEDYGYEGRKEKETAWPFPVGEPATRIKKQEGK